MIGIDIIQKAVIAELKSKSAITSLVTNSQSVVEIREAFWRGTNFEFPTIRVSVEPASPSLAGCEHTEFNVSVSVMSEETSSGEASEIQTAIAKNMPTSFSYSDGGTDYLIFGFRVSSSGLIPPTKLNIRLWQNEVRFQGQISLH